MGEEGFLHLLLTRGRHLTGSRSLPLFQSIHTECLSGDFTRPSAGTQKQRRAERAAIIRCNERVIFFIHLNRLERKRSNQENPSMNLTYCQNSTIVSDTLQIFCLTRDLQIQREKIAQSLGTKSFSTFLGQGLCHNFFHYMLWWSWWFSWKLWNNWTSTFFHQGLLPRLFLQQ